MNARLDDVRKNPRAHICPTIRFAIVRHLAHSAIACAASLVLATPSASADPTQPFALRLEAGGDAMLSQPSTRDFRFGTHGRVTGSWSFLPPVGVQLGIGAALFVPRSVGPTGSVYSLSAGLRVAPRFPFHAIGGPVLDGNVSAVLTGDLVRPMVDDGVGWEFPVSPSVSLGPMVRYAQVIQTAADQAPGDARFLGVSLLLSIGETPSHARVGSTPQPVRDADGDGVADPDDRCPLQPEDRDGHDDADGCPEADNDGDGIADASDRCPDARETVNGYQDADGCPDRPPPVAPRAPELRADRIEIHDRIQFEYDSADLREESLPVLTALASLICAHPEVRRVRIEGHSDDRGSANYNLALSDRRAASVRAFLEQHGVAADRLESLGYGETRHVCRDDTDECHARNRRVEFVITAREAAPAVAATRRSQ